MIGDYFTKALQGSQFRQLRNIILGIHEGDIPAYKASGRALLEERKIKLKKQKEEAQEAAKLASDQDSQGVCWYKSIKGNSMNGPTMHAKCTHYGV